MASTDPDHPPRALAAVLVCAGVVLVNLDLFIVNVAMPSLAETWSHASLADLSWVLNAYTVVFAALLVPAGRLSDRIGHRRAFLAGIAVFTVASALCAASPTLAVLVIARLAQAVGAALLMPASLGLLLTSYPPERRGAVIRAWAAIGGLAAALGPILGGLLLEPGWRWVFLVNLPIGVLTLVLGARRLPDPAPTDRGPLPDLLGAALLTVAIGALSLGVVRAPDWGWSSGRTLGVWVLTLLFVAGFLLRNGRHPRPVVEGALVRNRTYAVSGIANILFGIAFAGMLISGTMWMQTVWGWSALRTGLGTVPGPLCVPFVTIAAGRCVARFGPGPLVVVGGLSFSAGLGWWIARLEPHAHYASDLLPGSILTGIGVGLILPTLIATATGALTPDRFATGSGVITMLRQVGAALGVAVFVAAVGAPATLDGYDRAWYILGAATLLTAAAALFLPRPGRDAGAGAVMAGASEAAGDSEGSPASGASVPSAAGSTVAGASGVARAMPGS
ncbi:MFS transporter [Embleya scabrispora]|uniref:MFS transporter n=1 Tax=Embleya scabrispora TaxID=159449 RepID=UPI0003645FA6|nr:MFS transporter [Embleya scabrispora]MYS81114.1 MFS transporter [Streptomyces sp. SID5474]